MEPRANPNLLGQAGAERVLLESARSGRLAHAWLLVGPRGIGKATLAYRFARFLLATEAPPPALLEPPPADSLFLDPGHPVFRRVASGGHADLRVLARGINPKTGRARSEIIVDDVRAAGAFLRLTPAEGGWRILIADAAEEMNRNAQNALLKILEEPPPRAVIMLVSHAPGRLLPTIRSRCRRLDLRPPGPAAVAQLLNERLPDALPEDRLLAAELAEGSAGRGLAILETAGVDLYRDLVSLLLGLPSLEGAALHRQAEQLARSGAEDAYRMAADLLLGWLSRMVRQSASGEEAKELVTGERAAMRRLAARTGVACWIALVETLRRRFSLVEALNLDRRLVWVASILRIQRLAGT